MKRILCIAIAGALGTVAPGAEDLVGGPDSIPADSEVVAIVDGTVVVPAGTTVPLVMINSVSSKHSQPGDPVYLESVYPVVVDGRILIPAGTNVSGSVTRSKRPGRVKGRGRLEVRLEQMILPNGVIRDLTGRPGALDGRSPDSFDRESGQITSEGTKGEDVQDIATTTAAGSSIGTIAGAIGGRTGAGVAGGAIAGAAIGVTKVLLTRGPDAMLDRGTHIEMLLERELRFEENELDFENPVGRPTGGNGQGPDPRRNARRDARIGRFPL